VGTLIDSRTVQFESTLRSSYEKASIVPSVVGTRWYVENVDWNKKFEKLAFRLPTRREWFSDPDVSADMVFYEAGRSLAIREEGYLISKLVSSGREYQPKKEEKFEVLFTAADILRLKGFRPQVLFLPVENYSDFFKWCMERGLSVEFGQKQDILKLDTITRLSLHWSNKFSPFDQAMILDPTFAEWIAMPGDRKGSRLRIALDPEGDLGVEVAFHFDILKPDALVRWHVLDHERNTAELQDFLDRFRILEDKVSTLLSARKIAQPTADPLTLAKGLEKLDPRMSERMKRLLGLRNMAVHDPTHIGRGDVAGGMAELKEIMASIDRYGSFAKNTK
jgi:hypothetical protein